MRYLEKIVPSCPWCGEKVAMKYNWAKVFPGYRYEIRCRRFACDYYCSGKSDLDVLAEHIKKRKAIIKMVKDATSPE